MALNEALRSEIDGLIASDRVVLFMKGMRRMPQCGFSAAVVNILDELVEDYTTVNVLSRPDIREGIKEYSSWPTIPQLYVKGSFVGGSDIVRELYASGKLHELLGKKLEPVAPPKVTLTASAVRALEEAREQNEPRMIRFEVTPDFQHGLSFDPPADGDVSTESAGWKIVLDRASARRAEGATIDFVKGPSGAGFKITNPNAPPEVKQLSVEELKAKLDRGEAFELIDVRTPEERKQACIQGSRLLDQDTARRLESLDRERTLVFHCHHGRRSMQAAEHFIRHGFKDVYSVTGGIDAWSERIDPSVPRY